MGREDRALEAVLGALLREWSRDAYRGERSGRSIVVDEVGKRAYHQAKARGDTSLQAGVRSDEAKDKARELMGLPTPEQRSMDDLGEKRGA